MKVVCSYCQKVLSPPSEDNSAKVSHGMCESCYDHFINQWSDLRLGDYLDGFDQPVVVLTPDGRVVANNEEYSELFERDTAEIVGALSGDVMGCKNARLAGGCGKTKNCSTCSVRTVILNTLSKSKSHPKAKVFIKRDDSIKNFQITTELVGRVVAVIIDGLDGEA